MNLSWAEPGLLAGARAVVGELPPDLAPLRLAAGPGRGASGLLTAPVRRLLSDLPPPLRERFSFPPPERPTGPVTLTVARDEPAFWSALRDRLPGRAAGRGRPEPLSPPGAGPETDSGVILPRDLFRPLGLITRCVCAVGTTPDGRVWLGRRAADKETEPGLLDPLARGLARPGESLTAALLRETAEESGLRPADGLAPRPGFGRFFVGRALSLGLLRELLFVALIRLPAGLAPRPADGEVSEFLLLAPEQVRERRDAGELSPAAALALSYALGI